MGWTPRPIGQGGEEMLMEAYEELMALGATTVGLDTPTYWAEWRGNVDDGGGPAQRAGVDDGGGPAQRAGVDEGYPARQAGFDDDDDELLGRTPRPSGQGGEEVVGLDTPP